MSKVNSFICCFMVLLALSFSNAWAKKLEDEHKVSGIYLDVLRIDACTVKGCVVAGGPMQLNLLDLADGKVGFANKVLLPAITKELRLVLGNNTTITVDEKSFPLSVPGGKSSGLKLKGYKIYGKEGGLLSGLTLNLNLKKQLVIHAKKVKAKGKKNSVEEVLSFKLNPVIWAKTAEMEPLTDKVAAVLAMPDEENKITLGENFSLVIPAGAVSTPMVISVKETKYTVEVMDEDTGEVVEKPALSSNYELSPDGAEFAVPLKITIPYYPDALPSDVSEDDLAVYLDGEKIPTELDTTSKLASADVWHFTSAYVNSPSSNFVFPVSGLPGDANCPSTSYSVVWGGTYNDGCKGTGGHPGVDIRVPSDTSVKAIASGFVHKSYDSSTWGGLVVIKHEVKGISEPVWSVYAHLKRRDVQEGDPITVAGQQIGLSGGDKNDPNHGTSTGPHLHFQIDKGAVFLYPYWPSTGTEKFDTSLSANTYDPLKFIEDRTTAPPICPNGNGSYCGNSSIGQNTNTLYYCQDGHYQTLEQCSYGCEVMPSGTNDRCSYGANPSLRAVYRFWSDQNQSHFYTISESERNTVIEDYADDQWRYEGAAWYAYITQENDSLPVYRFWSDKNQSHFYTIYEDEKKYVDDHYTDDEWKYEGIEWYAYDYQKAGTIPVYRFWSDQNQSHFYTASEAEKDYVISAYSDYEWRYEGIAWHVFAKP